VTLLVCVCMRACLHLYDVYARWYFPGTMMIVINALFLQVGTRKSTVVYAGPRINA
jgi:hypothetical protein